MKQILIPRSSTGVRQGNSINKEILFTIAGIGALIGNLLITDLANADGQYKITQNNRTKIGLISKSKKKGINESTLIDIGLTTQQILSFKLIEANIILLKRKGELPSGFEMTIDKKIGYLDLGDKKIRAKIKKYSILNSELSADNYDNYISTLFSNNKTNDSGEELSYYKRVIYYIAGVDSPKNSLQNWFYNYNKLVKELREDNVGNRRKLLQMTLISISKQINANKLDEDEKLNMYKNVSLSNLLIAKDLFKGKFQFVRITFINSEKKTSKGVDELESFYIITSSNPIVNKLLNNDKDIEALINLSFESAKNKII